MATSDDEVEDESNHAPSHVVRRRGRRNLSCTGEYYRPVKILQEGVGVSSLYKVGDAGNSGANEEKPEKSVEDLSPRELACRPNDAPDD